LKFKAINCNQLYEITIAWIIYFLKYFHRGSTQMQLLFVYLFFALFIVYLQHIIPHTKKSDD